jgi:predicted TPR repeat methyltransferase
LRRDRLYDAYASQHAGYGDGEAAALVYRRDIRPVLPAPDAGQVLDIGCGQGELVRLLIADGYDAAGVDISPEQVSLAQLAALDQVLQGDYRDFLDQRAGRLAAVTAMDVLEHLAKDEVLDTFDLVASALIPGGVFVARVPNAASPLGGHIRYGDFTHESSYTVRSVRQLAAAAGFRPVTVLPCPPVGHGLKSAGRVSVWKLVSACYKLALATETGTLRGHIVTQNLTFVARKSG